MSGIECPFCGSDVNVVAATLQIYDQGGSETRQWYVTHYTAAPSVAGMERVLYCSLHRIVLVPEGKFGPEPEPMIMVTEP